MVYLSIIDSDSSAETKTYSFPKQSFPVFLQKMWLVVRPLTSATTLQDGVVSAYIAALFLQETSVLKPWATAPFKVFQHPASYYRTGYQPFDQYQEYAVATFQTMYLLNATDYYGQLILLQVRSVKTQNSYFLK